MQGPATLWQCSNSQEREEQLGLIPRTFEYLFARIAHEISTKVPSYKETSPYIYLTLGYGVQVQVLIYRDLQ